MQRSAIISGIILLVVLLSLGSWAPANAQDDQLAATIAALQTQVAQLTTRVAQLTTPAPTPVGGVMTESRPVHGVTAVELQTVGVLTIRQGPVEILTVTAETSVLPKLRTDVADGLLTIDAREPFATAQPVRYALTVTTLAAIANAGSGRIDVTALRVPRLRLVVAGSGAIALAALTAETLTMALTGSGSATAAGTVTRQTVELSGSGDYDGAQLASRIATVRASGSGRVTVRVSDRLDVDLRGSGDMAYVGTPQIAVTNAGSGQVRKAG